MVCQHLNVESLKFGTEGIWKTHWFSHLAYEELETQISLICPSSHSEWAVAPNWVSCTHGHIYWKAWPFVLMALDSGMLGPAGEWPYKQLTSYWMYHLSWEINVWFNYLWFILISQDTPLAFLGLLPISLFYTLCLSQSGFLVFVT